MSDHSPYFASRKEQQTAHADLVARMRANRAAEDDDFDPSPTANGGNGYERKV